MRHSRRTQALISLGLGFGAALLLGLAPTTSADAPNLAYAKDLNWHLDGAPELSAMESTIRSVLSDVHVTYAGIDGQPIEGFYPGPTYSYAKPTGTPFYFYIRDTATDLPMVRYYYGAPALRSSIEEFLREQYPDGSISASSFLGRRGFES